MRLHTNLEHDAIAEAAIAAGVTLVGSTQHGSRTHDRAFEVILSGSSTRASQWGPCDVKAATWDEWGMFLAAVFAEDPLARTRDYTGRAFFHWITTGRYHILGEVHGQECRQHRWRYSGDQPARGVEPAHYLSRCTKCGALLRRLA